jgi:Na+/melibiose symporter-like transporter
VLTTRLPLATLLAYAAPSLGFGFMTMLVNTYFMKYATDVLAIPAAAMGGILLASRGWDALADPAAGYLRSHAHALLAAAGPG